MESTRLVGVALSPSCTSLSDAVADLVNLIARLSTGTLDVGISRFTAPADRSPKILYMAVNHYSHRMGDVVMIRRKASGASRTEYFRKESLSAEQDR